MIIIKLIACLKNTDFNNCKQVIQQKLTTYKSYLNVEVYYYFIYIVYSVLLNYGYLIQR